MSLINDALKRAKQAQQSAPPPATPSLQLRPLESQPPAARGSGLVVPVVPISALTGEGQDALLDRIARMLTGGAETLDLVIPLGDGQRIAWLHANGEVLSEHSAEDANGDPARFGGKGRKHAGAHPG